MKILVIGAERDFIEFEKKFGHDHELTFNSDYQFKINLNDFDAVFDFYIGDDPDLFSNYQAFEDLPLFVNVPKISLAELAYFQDNNVGPRLFGFNGLPTFLDRSVLELSLLNSEDQQLLESLCTNLKTEYQVVEDRVGMVTPRIICMIINEAFYTVQEGTATKEDIDLGMKLGTNYPLGPFEWADKIGIQNVYELLESLYNDTKEERYKICPALKKAYLKA